LFVSSGSLTSGTVCLSGGGFGGAEFVHGSAVSTTLDQHAQQAVFSGGAASGTIVNGGGAAEFVFSGGTVSGTTVNSGGFEEVGTTSSAGGTAVGTTVNNGGIEVVCSGGVASGTILNHGGRLNVSGGTAIATTISGGTEYVSSAAAAQDVTFGGSSGTLDLATPAGLHGTISNWQIGDVIDFVSTSITSATIGGGLLNITTSGGQAFSYALANAQTDDVSLASDGAGGTDVLLEAEPPPTLTTPVISGTAQEGQTLNATPAISDDSDATVTYQWQESFDGGTSWSTIGGATSLTYVVQQADEGATLRIVATSSDPDGTGTTATSAATTTVTDIAPGNEGEKLRVLATSTDADGGGTRAVSKPTKPVAEAAPTLTLTSSQLTVPAGGSVGMGVAVAAADADDSVSVTISGLAAYESITDGLDHQTFSGSSITLTAAQVDGGLSLNSTFGGTGHPKNVLELTATNTAAGESVSSAIQKIAVIDPAAANSPASIDQAAALLGNYMACPMPDVNCWGAMQLICNAQPVAQIDLTTAVGVVLPRT
jgi:autotransporter passenger strand-loop-strand repeat protein